MSITAELKYCSLLDCIEKLKGAETGTREGEQRKVLSELAEEYKNIIAQTADFNPKRKAFHLF